MATNQLLELLSGEAGDKNLEVSTSVPVAPSPEIMKLLRDRQAQADTNMLVAGASSALGEFLFGGAGNIAEKGVEVMAGQMKRKQGLEDQETKMLMAQLKAKKGGSEKYHTPVRVYDEEGKAKFAYLPKDPSQGHVMTPLRPAYKPAILTGTEGEKYLQKGDLDKEKMKFGTDAEKAGITPNFEKFVNKRLPQVEAKLKEDRSALKQVSLAANTITMDGSFPSIQAIKSMIKTTDPRISDADFIIATKNLSKVQSAIDSAKQLNRTSFEPRLRGEIVRLLKKTHDVLRKSVERNLSKEVEAQTDSIKEKKWYTKRLNSVIPEYTVPKNFGEIRHKMINGKAVPFIYEEGKGWKEL